MTDMETGFGLDRATVLQLHAHLQSTSASPLAFGNLYNHCLASGLWSTQKELAKDLGVTTTRVSRCRAASRLPPELLEALKKTESLTYRSLMIMVDVVNQTGLAAARERAKYIPPRCTVRQIQSFMLGMEVSPSRGSLFRISAGPRNRYLRIDTPYVLKILDRQKEFEDMLHFVASVTFGK